MNLLSFFLSLSLFPLLCAYYGPPEDVPDMKIGPNTTVFRIGRDIYSYGSHHRNLSKFGIDKNKNLYTETYQVKDLDFKCLFCFSFVMKNDSVLTLTGYDNTTATNDSYNSNMGVYHFDPIENTISTDKTYKMLQGNPAQRIYHQAVITPDKKSVYIFGGIQLTSPLNANTSIVHLNISSSIFSSHGIFTFVGGTATMLPSGIAVLAFGAYDMNQTDGKALYSTSSVFLYDTHKNELYTQNVSGTPPLPRASASGSLGSNFDFLLNYSSKPLDEIHAREKIRSDLIILNTTSWTWIYPNVSGPPSTGRYGHFSLLYEDNSLIIGGGAGAYFDIQDDVSVIRNLPVNDGLSDLDHLEWFTNSELDSTYNSDEGTNLNPGIIAGVVIGSVISVIIIFYFLWKRCGNFKRFIWKKRLGEPVWTEIVRATTHFILLGFLIAYIISSIIRAINSPSLNQEQVIEKEKMPIPDIRICRQPYAEFSVSCLFSNSHECSGYFYPVKNTLLTPNVDLTFTKPCCQIFIPPLDIYFQSNKETYPHELIDDLAIDLYINDINKSTTFYFTYYTGENSPYRILFGLNGGDSEMTIEDANDWILREQGLPNLKDKFNTDNGNWATSTYSLTETRTLTNSSWNYFGFASIYKTTLSLNQNFSPIFLWAYPHSVWIPTFMLRIKPSEYSINVIKQQRVSTIIGGLASAGGVFSAFVAIKILFFGFRPNSPWGIIHRWSCGRQRKKLIDQLKYEFNTNNRPVPMATRVCGDYYLPPESSDSATLEMVSLHENNDDQSDALRLRKMEDRIQLMEDIFRTYYIDDEIFQRLNAARKDNHKNEDTEDSSRSISVKQADEETTICTTD